MMKKIILFTVGLSVFLGITNLIQTKAPQAMEKIDHPVVLELFTSRGCPACPAADKALSEFVKNDKVIALSCNVTYWDRAHRKDDLSKPLCDMRQTLYIEALNSDKVYTPQLLINGYYATVGSQTDRIHELMNKAPKIKSLDVSLDNKNAKIILPSLPKGDYDIVVIPYAADYTQTISNGREVNYTNPVIDIASAGQWDGEARDFNYDLSKVENMKGVAVLIHQNHEFGEIAAAGKVEL